jgi:hypothetical protein
MVIAKSLSDPDLGCSFLGFFLATVLDSFTEVALRVMEFGWVLFLLAATSVPAGLPPGTATEAPPVKQRQVGGLLGAYPPDRSPASGVAGAGRC